MRFRLPLSLLALTVAQSLLASVEITPADSVLTLYPEAEAKARAGDAAGAAEIYGKIVQQNPMLPDAWNSLASQLYNIKKYAESTEAYQKSLELGGGLPDTILYNIACNYGLLGDKKQALAYFDKAMKRGFAQINLLREDADLTVIREEPLFKEWAALADTTGWDRKKGWSYDIDLWSREVKRVHSAPWRVILEKDFDAELASIKRSLPTATDEHVMLRLLALCTKLGDGHTFIAPGTSKTMPVRMFLFEEGLHITQADAEHEDLLWARVEKIGGVPVDQVIKKVEPLISRDNAMNVKGAMAGRLANVTLLQALGLAANDTVKLEVVDRSGKEREVAVKGSLMQTVGHPSPEFMGVPKDYSGSIPLYRKDVKSPYWFEHLPAQKALYLQYNSVRNDPKENTDAFAKRLFEFAEANPVEKLIIDVRWNSGGNTFLHRQLVRRIIQSKFNKPGALYVITGRNTFSAAQNFVNYIERSTDAIFVGEPTGSSPNFIGETNLMTLPYSKMVCSVSNRMWFSSTPLDARAWVAPRIFTPPTIAAWKAGRDDALDAILNSAG